MLPRQSLGHIQKHAGRSELPISPPDCTRLIRRLILILIYGTQAPGSGYFHIDSNLLSIDFAEVG